MTRGRFKTSYKLEAQASRFRIELHVLPLAGASGSYAEER
jgi:hypothetical protein